MKKYPEGKFLGSVKIGPKGQIVIPKEVRDMFGLEQGNTLVLMADKSSGIALQPFDFLQSFWSNVNRVVNPTDTKEDKDE